MPDLFETKILECLRKKFLGGRLVRPVKVSISDEVRRDASMDYNHHLSCSITSEVKEEKISGLMHTSDRESLAGQYRNNVANGVSDDMRFSEIGNLEIKYSGKPGVFEVCCKG